MTDLFKSADKAAEEAAYVITNSLYNYLVSAGWSNSAARSIKVISTPSGFDVKFEGPAVEEAQTLEYGDEYTRPTGAIRKFMNQAGALQKILLDRYEEKLGDIL